jgi:acetoin:2,6-dichlorophenolindophenol oxidoreductase subunit beta
MKVVAPSNPADAYGLLLPCIFDDDPCVFIENLPLYFAPGEAPERGVRVPLGQAKVVREGSDVTLISYSRMVQDCAAVAEKLAKEGIHVELIDLRTISPLDEATLLRSVAKTRRAVVVHEAVRRFGVGAEIAALLHEHLFGDLKAPVQRVGANHSPVPFSKTLEMAHVPQPATIEAAIRKTLD